MRSLRRHHRARRIAAVERRQRDRFGWIDEPRRIRMQARTRTPCSCGVCKHWHRERDHKRRQTLAFLFRETVNVDADRDAAFEDVCRMDDLDDSEDDQRWHREQLDAWERELNEGAW